jgi:diguanylate cyclase (GGDEF)-like protein
MRQRLNAYFARREQPYAGAVIEISRRMTGGVALVSALMSSILLAFAPPHDPLGTAGWAIAAIALAATLAGAVAALRPRSVLGWNAIALVGWVGLAALGLLVWLTGGDDSPHTTLLLLWIVVFAACHAPRRAAGYLAVAGLVTVAPLAYDSAPLASAGEAAAQLVVWFFMAAIANIWVVSVRADRLSRIDSEEQAITLARVDPLTGLGNRRAFDEALASLVGRAHELREPLSIVVADLDRFKQINDRFGHLAGDLCLREVANAIRVALRGSELIYRWGGDEFVILLTRVDYAAAAGICERLTRAIASTCASPDGEPMRVKCGFAQLEPDMDADELLAAADLALMGRKRERVHARPG